MSDGGLFRGFDSIRAVLATRTAFSVFVINISRDSVADSKELLEAILSSRHSLQVGCIYFIEIILKLIANKTVLSTIYWV